METTQNNCSCGEGRVHCIWWVTGCIHPLVSQEVKRACNGKLDLEREKEAVNP